MQTELPSCDTLRQLGLDKLRNASSRDIQQILDATIDCVAWCELRIDPGHPASCFRSDKLKPWQDIDDAPVYQQDKLQGLPAAMHALCAKRSEMVQGVAKPSYDQLPRKGRFLVLWPAETLVDGAAEAVSHGYFDIANVPPWDTWVGLAELNYSPAIADSAAILSWVPSSFISLVSEGLWTNPEECIQWLVTDLQAANYNRQRTIPA